MELTPEQASVAKVLSSQLWRLNHLYWIEDTLGRKVKFQLNWAQLEFFNRFWYRNNVLKARQLGISTFVGLLQLDRCLFTPNQTCGIIDKTDDDAQKKLAKQSFAYDHLDDPDDPVTAPLGAAIKQAVRKVTDNARALEFSNNSKIWGGTSLRGGTINFLHVSELGPIALKHPEKAKEIAAGSFNTVSLGNIIVIESTHEGGRYGLNYEMINLARASGGKPESELDWMFFFFPWWREPTYALQPTRNFAVPSAQAAYFRELEAQHRITLTPAQKYWYVKKASIPDANMAQQFPASPEEALRAKVAGAIYGEEMSHVRSVGRVRNFTHDRNAQVYSFWDIGQSDYTAIWLLQFVGLDILAIDYLTFHGATPAHYVARLLEMERDYGMPIAQHYLPHDGATRTAVGITYIQALKEAGLKNIKRVPRTPDTWIGIKHLRTLLPRFYFHAITCEKDVKLDGQTLPSGLAALEGYHTKIEAIGGAIKELPVHDASSHGCDALRTFAEAHQRGMIEGPSALARNQAQHLPKVTTGVHTTMNQRVRSGPLKVTVTR